MMLLDQIKLAVEALPLNDRFLARTFIQEREFEALLELVNSDIILVEINANKESTHSNPTYSKCNLADIIALRDLVSIYVDGLTIPELENDTYDD